MNEPTFPEFITVLVRPDVSIAASLDELAANVLIWWKEGKL